MLDALATPPPLSSDSVHSFKLAPWHAQNPQGLANALMRAREAAPHLDDLAEFLLPRLPRGVLCSSTIKDAIPGQKSSSQVRPLEFALGHQWMAFNCEKWTNAETADCDDADWDERLDELTRMGLPAPLFIAVSPWKGSAHLAWAYDRPVNNEDPRQTRLRRGVKRGLAVAFGADPRFANRLQKNPWHLRPGPIQPGPGRPGNVLLWESYELSQPRTTYHTIVSQEPQAVPLLDLFRPLAAYAADRGIRLLQPTEGATRRVFVRVPTPAAPAPLGSRLFHAARVRVYRACTADADTIRGIVQRMAAEMGSPAQAADVDGITASVRTFMLERWTGPLDGRSGQRGTRDIDHGVMTREAQADGCAAEWDAMSVTDKRVAAALRSAARSKGSHDDAVQKAAEDQVADGLPLTKAAIAARSGASLSTVQRRWKLLSIAPANRSNGPNPLLPSGTGATAPSARPSPENPSSSFSSLAELARRDRGVRRAVAILARAAAEAARPGAVPLPLPKVDPDVAAAPAVRQARRVAEAAVVDARRRAEARVARRASAERAADMRRRAADLAAGWTWFRQHVADLDEEWDAREAGADPEERPGVRLRREAVLIGRWRSWRAAVRHHRPEPPDQEIPW